MASARFELYLNTVGRADNSVERTVVAWRLLTNNNRDLGRGAAFYPDVVSCADAVRQLQRGLVAARSAMVRSGRTTWTWRITVDGREVAASSRTYQRRVQAESACTVFLSLAAAAEIADNIRSVRS
jgi:hypothetical protein